MGLITKTNDTAISLQEKEYLDDATNSNDMDQHESFITKSKANGYQGCPLPIDIEFVDLTYTVPIGRNGQ